MGSFHGKKKKEKKIHEEFSTGQSFLLWFSSRKRMALWSDVSPSCWVFFLLHGKHDMAVCNSALKFRVFFLFFRETTRYKTLKWFFVNVIFNDGQGIFSHFSPLYLFFFFKKKHHHVLSSSSSFSVLADSPIFWLVAPKSLHWVDTNFFYFWKQNSIFEKNSTCLTFTYEGT